MSTTFCTTVHQNRRIESNLCCGMIPEARWLQAEKAAMKIFEDMFEAHPTKILRDMGYS